MSEVGTRKRGGLIIFLVGLLLGVLAAVFAPRYLGDYLPGSIGGKSANVTGVVTRKLAEDTRLLLTVVTDSGAVLATFTDRKAEIDLLVEEGDSVTFSLSEYSPFVDDPRLGRVAKPVRDAGSTRQPPGTPGETETPGISVEPDTTPGQPPADTAAEVAPDTGAKAPDL
jgi:hypothetical protein